MNNIPLTYRFSIALAIAYGAFLVLNPCDARADMEGRMPLAHIELDSQGLDNSGPVRVSVRQSVRGVSELEVLAFGKRYTLTPAQLNTLGARTFNTMGLTYSRGYPETGGRGVYVLLCQGFSSGVKVVEIVIVEETNGIHIMQARPPGSS